MKVQDPLFKKLFRMLNGIVTVENSMVVPPKIKIELLYDPVLLWGIYPEYIGNISLRIEGRDSCRCLSTHVHSSTIPQSQEVEAT